KRSDLFLKINEKKVYSFAQGGKLPGTKVMGKRIFPKVERAIFLRCYFSLKPLPFTVSNLTQ
ncbi:MAG: helix-turn-helix domain-containing protein, partial [Deltaproteobacteria bacterium]|nr:helix-turn-helix domain-containing protein [Deltaproteobacteria bacterium]